MISIIWFRFVILLRSMRLKRFISVFLGVFCAYSSIAQTPQMKGELVQSRILILLDESSSMIETWADGKEKYMAARELIAKLMDSVYAVNNQVEFGLRVFGHQHTVAENNCYDTRLEVAFSKDNKVQMGLRLADIHPLGVTPIAYALSQAAENDLLDEKHNVYSIILITDGGESCGGDICEVMKNLLKDKVYFKPYIVSLENDPTLKKTYSCMGDFLQVTNQGDIPPAVGTIVEAFRPVIKITQTEYKELQTISANAPSVLKVSVPVKTWKTPVGASISLLSPADPKPFNITLPVAKKIKKTELGFTLPPIVMDALPPPEKITVINPTHQKPFNTAVANTGNINTMDLGLKMPPVAVEGKIAALKPAHLRQLPVIYVIEELKLATVKVPSLPKIKTDQAATLAVPGEKQREYRIETEDASETTVEVYFTNGTGTFYSTTPQVLLIDPETKQVLKRFFRTIDADGNPDPQHNIPVGVYDLSFAAKTNFVLHGVEIQQHKKNKIFVIIHSTSLSFAYDKAPDRPVSEFTAVVTERNKAHGRVQEQKCTDAQMYEPGNYHIVINTFPKEIRNVDLDFDDETVITIPQPGFAKFTTDGNTRVITLFQRLGDKFLPFHTLDLNDPRSQHLQMQPGEYQAHYQKGPGQANAAEQVILFVVKPTQETEVILK